jgi:hypothetical protein
MRGVHRKHSDNALDASQDFRQDIAHAAITQSR